MSPEGRQKLWKNKVSGLEIYGNFTDYYTGNSNAVGTKIPPSFGMKVQCQGILPPSPPRPGPLLLLLESSCKLNRLFTDEKHESMN